MHLPRPRLRSALVLVALLCLPGVASAQFLPSSQATLVRTLLNGVNSRYRAEAAFRLGQTGDPRVLEALATAAAHDTEPEVRRAARDAIRNIRGTVQQPPPGPGFFPPQQGDDYPALIDSWYQRYLGRCADRGGLVNHVAMLRQGHSLAQVQANLLASEEFWRRSGQNPTGFIDGLYRTVLGRAPDRAGLFNWGQRYNGYRGDRMRLATEFVESAQQELLSRQQNNPIIPW